MVIFFSSMFIKVCMFQLDYSALVLLRDSNFGIFLDLKSVQSLLWLDPIFLVNIIPETAHPGKTDLLPWVSPEMVATRV